VPRLIVTIPLDCSQLVKTSVVRGKKLPLLFDRVYNTAIHNGINAKNIECFTGLSGSCQEEIICR